jgi:SAM-dependent methyltransferase
VQPARPRTTRRRSTLAFGRSRALARRHDPASHRRLDGLRGRCQRLRARPPRLSGRARSLAPQHDRSRPRQDRHRSRWGTGKFTPKLIATGASIIAVEPVRAMRSRLAQDLPAITVLDGTADAIPLPDASADAVICAQAFHWFATREALAEIARVLKPAGMLGLVWNVRDLSVPWVADIDAIITPYEGDMPRFLSGAWRNVFPARGFSAREESSFPHGRPCRGSNRRPPAVGKLHRQPAHRRTRQGCARASRPHRTGAGLAAKPAVTFPYVTQAYSAQRL